MSRQFFTPVSTLMPVSALMIAVGLALVAADAFGQATMQFAATKDDQITSAPPEQMSNAGAAPGLRVLFFGENTTLMDFDTDAMDTFLQANPGSATWTLNIAPVPGAGSFVVPAPGQPEVQIMTIESLNDWAEGDGTSTGPGTDYAWTSGTAAATFFYAQASHNGGLLDLANSREWVDPDSGIYTFNRDTPHAPDPGGLGVPLLNSSGNAWANNPTPEFVNSVNFSWDDVGAAQTSGSYASLTLDSLIINALIADENNRGLRFGPLNYGANGGSKWQIYSKDFLGGLFAPYLEVTIAPGQTGDYNNNGVVDAADYAVWLDALGSAASLPNDPLGGTIGSAQYDQWKANFGNPPGVGTGSGTPVPEPCTLVLAFAMASIAFCRRQPR